MDPFLVGVLGGGQWQFLTQIPVIEGPFGKSKDSAWVAQIGRNVSPLRRVRKDILKKATFAMGPEKGVAFN